MSNLQRIFLFQNLYIQSEKAKLKGLGNSSNKSIFKLWKEVALLDGEVSDFGISRLHILPRGEMGYEGVWYHTTEKNLMSNMSLQIRCWDKFFSC